MPLVCPYQNHDNTFYVACRDACFFTASQIPDLLGVGYTTAQNRIAYKRGDKEEIFNQWSQEAMERGHQEEPNAAAYFHETMLNGRYRIEETGFWIHPDIPELGATPDRLIYKDVMDDTGKKIGEEVWSVEIKVPKNVFDKTAYSEKWLCYRIQLEVQMRIVDNCKGGYLVIYSPEEPSNTEVYSCKPDAMLWGIIVENFFHWSNYLLDTSIPVPATVRGEKKKQIMEWAEERKKACAAGPRNQLWYY